MLVGGGLDQLEVILMEHFFKYYVPEVSGLSPKCRERGWVRSPLQ